MSHCYKKLVRIIYSMPIFDMLEKVKRAETYLGGCEIIIDLKKPIYYCYKCKQEYYDDFKSVEE